MSVNYAGEQGAAFLSVIEAVEAGQGGRLGCSVGALRCLLRVSALRQSGASVYAQSVTDAGLGEASRIRGNVAECLRLGFLVRASARGPLDLTSAGRGVVGDCVRAWHRSVRQLLAFMPVQPYPSVSRPKQRRKAAEQTERSRARAKGNNIGG